MTDFRLVRAFAPGVNPSTEKAYRVETAQLMSEQQALGVLRDLGSPYSGRKYEDAPPSGAKPAPSPTDQEVHDLAGVLQMFDIIMRHDRGSRYYADMARQVLAYYTITPRKEAFDEPQA